MTTTERLANALAYLDALHVPDGLTQTISLEPDGHVEIAIFPDGWKQADSIIRTIDPTLTAEHWEVDAGAPGCSSWATYTGPDLPAHLTEITVFGPQFGDLGNFEGLDAS
jgi:hypothetical protein